MRNHRLTVTYRCVFLIMGNFRKRKNRGLQYQDCKNKNLGGVGGFTRTMFEHMRDDKITHVLLMDDDAVISPEAIEQFIHC